MFGLGGWLLSAGSQAAEQTLRFAKAFRMYVAQSRTFRLPAAQPSAIQMHAAQPKAFDLAAAQPSVFRIPVAGFQTELDSEDIVARKIWTDDIDQDVDAMPDGVFLYKTGGIWSATALTMDMIGPAFACTLSGGGLVEDGATVTNPAFTASYTSSPTSVTIHDTQNATPATVALPATSFTRTGSYAFSGLGTSKTFTLTASNGTTTVTDTAAYTTGQRVYYGAATPGTHNAAFVQALASSVVTTTRARTVTYTLTVGQRPYYFVPSGMSAPTAVIGGFTYTWTDLGAITVPNPQGASIAGHLYAGDVAGASVTYQAVFS